jgi:hypothetical protein
MTEVTLSAKAHKQTFRSDFLENLTIDHGPVQLLGRFFATSVARLSDAGLQLSLEPLANAVSIHEENIGSWPVYPPMLDTRLSPLRPDRSYCFVCRTIDGTAVAVMGARIYDDRGSFAACVVDQSFIYEGAPTEDGPRFETNFPSAPEISCPFSYIGALWVRPDYRGRDLARILPAITRAYGLAKWNTKYDVGLVKFELAHMGKVYGYTKMESRFWFARLSCAPKYAGLVLWMDREELADNLRISIDRNIAQIDRGVIDSAANQK